MDEIKTIIEKRMSLWEEIKRIPEGYVEVSLIYERSIRKVKRGISIDSSDIAISVGPTEKYPNTFFNGGVLYSYPNTAYKGYDRTEIKSVKRCLECEIPLFVILPGKIPSTRTIKLGWVMKEDNEKREFRIEYGEERPVMICSKAQNPL